MKNDHNQLKNIWTKAVDLYEKESRDPANYFDKEETVFIDSIGVSPQEVFDFVEDFVSYGEPDFEAFAQVHGLRRRYFQEVQDSRSGSRDARIASYPDPNDSHNGIAYLPRIAAKAKTKLDGSLNPDIMYACSNDRLFLERYNIQPAEFLKKTWETEGELNALASWVKSAPEKEIDLSL